MSLKVKQCYTKEGSVAKVDIPCDPNAEVSACCGVDSACVENYFCKDSGGNSVPGTCTDQLWGARAVPNPACPCQTHFKNDNTTLNYSDSVTFCPDGSICCGISNFDCCDAGKGNPIIQYGNNAIIPTLSATAAVSSYYAGVRVTTLPMSSRTITSKSTGTSTSSGTETRSTTAAGSVASVASTGDLVQNGHDSLSQGARIAIGVSLGVIVTFIIMLLLFWLIFWRRYKRLQNKFSAKEWSPMTMGRFEAPAENVLKMKKISVIHPALREKHEYVRDGRKRSWMVWARNEKPVEIGDSSLEGMR